ncbi:uncharacterized protein [Diabrotica undecimpunctata]|uniref:uncharacterized protein n=1 Tax=Diabrotica undecimpunctata TaxID=50387 RepID=UPI003B63D626
MCILRLRGTFFNYSILNVHARTEEKEDDAKEKLYEELEAAYHSCPKFMVISTQKFLPTIGKHSLHEVSNDNGIRLINLATSVNMVIASTCFQRKNIHKRTWRSPDGVTVYMIDHVIIDSRHHSDVTNVCSRRRANADSDHYLVETRIRARISNIKKEDPKLKNMK